MDELLNPKYFKPNTRDGQASLIPKPQAATCNEVVFMRSTRILDNDDKAIYLPNHELDHWVQKMYLCDEEVKFVNDSYEELRSNHRNHFTERNNAFPNVEETSQCQTKSITADLTYIE